MVERLSGIKTNIITGFLGAGKSTAILHLLNSKPSTERWAILVNEFGEVGIDGGLLAADCTESVFIREVPGGCMCCTAGLPMQMALNMLLARSKPDRLIIEPTGLGHPTEVMTAISTEHYEDVLDIRATLTLVDARKIKDERYAKHATFNEQLEIADVVVASKSDLYDTQDLDNLQRYLQRQTWFNDGEIRAVSEGQISIDWLESRALSWKVRGSLSQPTFSEFSEPKPDALPPEGYIRLSNSGEGFFSHGWIFEPSFRFEKETVDKILENITVERMKALIRTTDGDRAYNYAGDQIENINLIGLDDTRIELITETEFPVAQFEEALLAAAIQR